MGGELRGKGAPSLKSILVDSYLGVQQVVTCKGQIVNTKKCKWDMLAQGGPPQESLCAGPALKVMDEAWAPSSAVFRLLTTTWRTRDGQILTITPSIFVVLLLGSVWWNAFLLRGQKLWQVLSGTNKNKLQQAYSRCEFFVAPDARIMSAYQGGCDLTSS